MAPLVPDTDAPLPADSIPDDHEFVCLTLGPSVFGAPDDRPPFPLDTARIHFRSPVAVGAHWPRLIGTVSLDKLYRTRLAFVASDSNSRRTGSETAGEAIARFEHRAYTALRAILIQGNPFENSVSGLEIRRVFDAGRFREESALMRPRTSHPWEEILSIDDRILQTALSLSRSLHRVFVGPDDFARLRRGLDHWDQATMEHRLDLRLHALVRALEALFAPVRGRTQREFVDRCKVVVYAHRADRLLNEIYELRSQVEHSNDWRLAFQGTRPSFTDDAAELLAIFRVLQVELIARRAYQRVLLDPAFMDCFRTDQSIHALWASRHRADLWGAPMNLESTVRSVFDHHKTEVLQQVLRLER